MNDAIIKNELRDYYDQSQSEGGLRTNDAVNRTDHSQGDLLSFGVHCPLTPLAPNVCNLIKTYIHSGVSKRLTVRHV